MVPWRAATLVLFSAMLAGCATPPQREGRYLVEVSTVVAWALGHAVAGPETVRCKLLVVMQPAP